MAKYKYRLIALFLTLFILGGWWFITNRKPYVSPKNTLETKEKTVLTTVNSKYAYEKIASRLKSKGISLLPIEDEILSQIFPKSKIWKFTDKDGIARFLLDGLDKVEQSLIDGKTVITEKVVTAKSVSFDYDGDGKKELIVFVLTNFKDVALCCDQKKYLSVFKIKEGKTLIYEQEVEIYRGNWQIEDLSTLDLNRDGKDEVLELKTFGDGYTGAYTTIIRWFIVEDKKFKEIWKETLKMNMDIAGVIPEEEKENYQTRFKLYYEKNQSYPKIEVTNTYTKRFGKVLPFAEEATVEYIWSPKTKNFKETSSQ